jgi:hypothetical protein
MDMHGHAWTCMDMHGHELTVVDNITYCLVERVIKNKGTTKVIIFIVSQAVCYYTSSINDIAASAVRKSGQVTLLSILCYASV